MVNHSVTGAVDIVVAGDLYRHRQKRPLPSFEPMVSRGTAGALTAALLIMVTNDEHSLNYFEESLSLYFLKSNDSNIVFLISIGRKTIYFQNSAVFVQTILHVKSQRTIKIGF